MSRASSSSQQRSLSLTEELEKLEQSITLTLQEIDHNFSRAHRIVTSSILPIVEQYSEHSREVWEGSKFWKQFFESSANVSLSGYEEQPSTHEAFEETVTEDSNATAHTTLESSQSYETPSSQHLSMQPPDEELDLSSLSLSPSHSTPRPVKSGQPDPNTSTTFADYPSPYEALRQGIGSKTNAPNFGPPETPGKLAIAVAQTETIAMTPDSSPFLPTGRTLAARPSTARKKTDPLLHRVLDKNYRVQATPLASGRQGSSENSRAVNANAATTSATPARARLFDSALSSSPEMPAAPQLHAEIFSSPAKGTKSRTPGISVLTPAKGKETAAQGIWDSDGDFDEDEDEALASPPKTMQFHIPQSRLLQTPAKEASKRIVEDLLMSAGVGGGDDEFTDEIDERMMDATSPSVIRKAAGFEDETF